MPVYIGKRYDRPQSEGLFLSKFEIVTPDFSRLKGSTVLYHHGV